MHSLDTVFKRNGTDKDMGHHGYADTYSTILDPIREDPITLIEIGVQYGCSINSWLEYLPNAHIVGVDIQELWNTDNPRYRQFKGSHGDMSFMRHVADQVKSADIVIDDGSHSVIGERVSFECLWPIIIPGGYYVIEDIHVWFDDKHDGSYHDGARDLLWRIASAINWSGKRYYGRPFADESPSDYDLDFDSMVVRRGLLVIHKAYK